VATSASRKHEYFTRLSEQPHGALGGTEMTGAVLGGQGQVTKVALGELGLVVHLDFKKGFLQPGHSHPEHESLGYVVNGKLRMVVDGEEEILEAGSGWWHPIGSHHITEALEDSEALEIHLPPRQDILDRFVA
jgi:quercetin dioxygenase-like cupin family protein